MAHASFKKQKRVFIAYADGAKNQFLVRKGKQFFHLSSQSEMRKLSIKEAYQIFLMISTREVEFRGIGSFQNLRKGAGVK
ncbi:hypothetical protein [Lentibacillus sp. CBA3610]|uniref:hypothetical protein n=1 Tax=Lentibacillus sp. CBA3610 TaxID=2518176 RepID=UPI001595E5B5|nr:hypothetical protein [Lentibacillus sp. CBA3610]QKY69350.1 hypothetical protein Len3610_06835 [Lentibacillus sp. CBA3610]